jgi:hypothetical protein
MINYSSNLVYGLKTSFDEMSELIESRDQHEFNYRLGNSVLWILICQERIKKLIPDDELFLGIRCAANALKHNELLCKLQEQTGFKLPTVIPFELGRTYVWASLDHASKEIRHQDQINAYRKCLEGKKIDDTLRIAKDIIMEIYEKDNLKSPPQA